MRVVWILLAAMLISGCSSAKSRLANCEGTRERLLGEMDALKQENERLAIENRSRTHRLAEAEKRLARDGSTQDGEVPADRDFKASQWRPK